MAWWWMEAQVGGRQPTRIKHDTRDLEISTLVQTFQPKPRDQLGGNTIRAVNHPVLAATPRTMGCGLVEIFNRRAGMIGGSWRKISVCVFGVWRVITRVECVHGLSHAKLTDAGGTITDCYMKVCL